MQASDIVVFVLLIHHTVPTVPKAAGLLNTSLELSIHDFILIEN